MPTQTPVSRAQKYRLRLTRRWLWLTALGCQVPQLDLRELDLPVYGQRADQDALPAVARLQEVAASADSPSMA